MDDFLTNCSTAVLAGGENKRMPALKAFIRVNGEKIIERNLRILKQLFKEVFIVTNQPENYLYLKTHLLGDIYDTRCPMTGIFTALVNSSFPWVFISACDMPFISDKLIRFLSQKRHNCDAVVPAPSEKIEPLFAFYSKRLIPYMEKTLSTNKRSLQDFLKKRKVKFINNSDILRVDADKKSFVNINTPEDLNLKDIDD